MNSRDEEISSKGRIDQTGRSALVKPPLTQSEWVLGRELAILADDVDDAKVRAKQLLANEGYDEKLLHRATWTVTRLDRPRKR
jgi:hypothetical protein